MNNIIIKYFIMILVICSNSYGQNLQWQEIGRMPIPVKGHRAVVLDSVILIIGGYSDSLESPVDVIQEYNPYTGNWRIIGKLMFKRTNFLASSRNDSVFVYGGLLKSKSINDYYTIEIFKRNSQPYIYRRNPIFNRIFSASMIREDKLYLIGGKKSFRHSDTTQFKYLIEYDLIQDQIIFFITNFPGPEIPSNQTIASLNDNIFIFGGVSGGILNKIYKYNIYTKEFTRIPIHLLQPRAGGEAVVLNNNSILIIGGFNEKSKALSTTEIFEINGTSLSVRSGPSLITPRREFAAVRFENSIYVFGGENQFEDIVSKIEKLNLTTEVQDESPEISNLITLNQNYPNPFNPKTTISFKIPQKMKVNLEIFDIFGKRIKTLINQELEAGEHYINWNGNDENGNLVSSGIYFCRLSSDRTVLTKKMTLLK